MAASRGGAHGLAVDTDPRAVAAGMDLADGEIVGDRQGCCEAVGVSVGGNRTDAEVSISAGARNHELAALLYFDGAGERLPNAHESFSELGLAVAADPGDAVNLAAMHCEAEVGHHHVAVGPGASEL